MAESKQSKEPVSQALLKGKEMLSDFLKANSSSYVIEVNRKKSEGTFLTIMQPWGDSSLALLFEDESDGFSSNSLADVLNKLILPERLTAIYHRDDKVLEIIWTAYQILDPGKEVVNRAFTFRLDGREHHCEFKRSSNRLLLIATRALFLSVSDTGFRNLQSFASWADKDSEGADGGNQTLGEPVSFFITNVEWREEDTLSLLRHLNFYLRYYDTQTPYVVIHPPVDKTIINPKSRYIENEFPTEINGRKLNPTLLAFWIAAFDEEPATSFLLHFRIMEFVTSYYLEGEQRAAIQKILSSPHIASSMSSAIDSLVGVIREERPQDAVRFAKMVRDLVDDEKIWQEICLNPDAFSKEVTFDGGFKLPALVANTKSKDAFGPQGLENFARALRKIRNALAHGGEAQSGQIILPTSRNFKKLLPWVHLIGTAAGEVVLYEHLS